MCRTKINKVGVQINTGQISLAGMKAFMSGLEKAKEKRKGGLSLVDQVEFKSFRLSSLSKPKLKTQSTTCHVGRVELPRR